MISFAGVTALKDYLMSDHHAAVRAAEQEFTDVAGSEYWTALNYNIINRLFPEQATRR